VFTLNVMGKVSFELDFADEKHGLMAGKALALAGGVSWVLVDDKGQVCGGNTSITSFSKYR